jgi:O-antigen/teichoic acid export membrane protein
MTGTTIAQAIPIAISPVLTRIYTPEDFGILAIFTSITLIFGSIANGRYEIAIMLPEDNKKAINIFALGFIINLCLSFFLFLVVLIFNGSITNLIGNNEIRIWLYFTPLTVFFIGFFNLLNYFNNRLKNYKGIASATIYKSIAIAVIQLILGFLKKGPTGLISGQIISQFYGNLKLAKFILKDKALISKINFSDIKSVAKKYKDFPKFSLLATLANSLSYSLFGLLISAIFSLVTLGFYSLVQRVLLMPSLLIGSSIGQVFYQEAMLEKQETGSVIVIFKKTLKKLILIGVPAFSFFFLIVEELFVIVFGEEWRVAGEYAAIVTPLFFVRFIVSVFTLIPIIYERVKIDLIFQFGVVFLSLVTLYFSKILKVEFNLFLVYYALILTTYYICYFIFLLLFFLKKDIKIII